MMYLLNLGIFKLVPVYHFSLDFVGRFKSNYHKTNLKT